MEDNSVPRKITEAPTVVVRLVSNASGALGQRPIAETLGSNHTLIFVGVKI